MHDPIKHVLHALSQVWKMKITIHEEEALPEVLTTPPNESHHN